MPAILHEGGEPAMIIKKSRDVKYARHAEKYYKKAIKALPNNEALARALRSITVRLLASPSSPLLQRALASPGPWREPEVQTV